MKIKKIAHDFSVCKVKDYSQTDLDAEFCFIGKTDEEKSPGVSDTERAG